MEGCAPVCLAWLHFCCAFGSGWIGERAINHCGCAFTREIKQVARAGREGFRDFADAKGRRMGAADCGACRGEQ